MEGCSSWQYNHLNEEALVLPCNDVSQRASYCKSPLFINSHVANCQNKVYSGGLFGAVCERSIGFYNRTLLIPFYGQIKIMFTKKDWYLFKLLYHWIYNLYMPLFFSVDLSNLSLVNCKFLFRLLKPITSFQCSYSQNNTYSSGSLGATPVQLIGCRKQTVLQLSYHLIISNLINMSL